MGFDPVSKKNFDHRKLWIEDRLQELAASFGSIYFAFRYISNHFHLILRSRPDVVTLWDDTEVARRWLTLCPIRKRLDGTAEEPNEFELNMICNNPIRVKEIRKRLSDITGGCGCFVRILQCELIKKTANRANFFKVDTSAVRLCDEEALLACSAYVDLNPIRAAMAEKLEDSEFTSIQRRIEELQSSAPKENNLAQSKAVRCDSTHESRFLCSLDY